MFSSFAVDAAEDQADLCKRLLRLDPTLIEEFVLLGSLYHQKEYVSSEDMLVATIARLQYFPTDISLWKIFGHCASKILIGMDVPSPLGKVPEFEWKYKLHWIKGNFLSLSSLFLYTGTTLEKYLIEFILINITH